MTARTRVQSANAIPVRERIRRSRNGVEANSVAKRVIQGPLASNAITSTTWVSEAERPKRESMT